MDSQKIIKEFKDLASGLDLSKLELLEPVKELQRTDDWFTQRRYKFTSSCIYKLLTEPRSKLAKEAGELSEGAKSYIMEKVTEDVGGFLPEFSSSATSWGEENEDLAREAYRLKTGNKIEEVGFCLHSEFYGGSPDATVIDFRLNENILGGLEIKCPYNSTNHLWHCVIDSQGYFKSNHPDYYWQCISHCITLDCQWCDFVSYDPRIKEKYPELALFIFRVYKDESDANLLLRKLDKALEHKNEIKLKLGIK